MSNLKRKLEVFKNSVLNESTADAEKILKELRAKKEAATRKLEADIPAEVSRYKAIRLAEISAREARRVSTERTEKKKQHLQYRENCAHEVFDEARKRIADFTASKEYPAHMAGLLRRAVKQLGEEGYEADVYLRPVDMHLSQFLMDSVSGVSLNFYEGTFVLGGLYLSCPSKGLRVDMSFDSAIADIVGHFSELSGMNVD